MKKLFFLSLAVFALYSCNGNKSAKDTEEAAVGEFSEIAEGVTNEHNAELALDYVGIYKGVLPAADGPGMEVVIVLGDSTFTKTTTYVGKTNKPAEVKGAYKWADDGNTIILEGVEAPNQYFVGENTLTQLDVNGKRIQGDIAKEYILTKEL